MIKVYLKLPDTWLLINKTSGIIENAVGEVGKRWLGALCFNLDRLEVDGLVHYKRRIGKTGKEFLFAISAHIIKIEEVAK